MQPLDFDAWWELNQEPDAMLAAQCGRQLDAKQVARMAWDTMRERCAQVADETLVLVPFIGNHQETAFGSRVAKEMAEQIAARIRGSVV